MARKRRTSAKEKIHPMVRTKRAVQTRHREPVDEHAATELVMYIENESDLSPDGPSGQGRSVLLNMLRKWKKGTYDPTLAVRQFEWLTEAGAKRYAKEFGSSEKEWSTMFNPATRHEAAKQLEASFRGSAENGEYDQVDTRIGVREGVEEHRGHTVAIGGNGTVIPSRRWKHKRTGATASPYGAVPWTGAPGNREEDWEMQNVGWTIRWDDETIGIGRPPFPTKEEAETWLERDRARRASYWNPQPPPERAPAPRRRRRTAHETPHPRIDAFTRQYMETALWSSTDESDDRGGDPLDKNYSISDIAPETRAKMIADCADFQERFGELYDDSEQAGHDFWLSRNGHGTGFFDRDTPNADKLQDAAKSYGEYNLYVGDDGMIYGS